MPYLQLAVLGLTLINVPGKDSHSSNFRSQKVSKEGKARLS